VDITAAGNELRDAARLARESIVVGHAVTLGRWIGTGRRPLTAGQALRKADVPAAGAALGVDVPSRLRTMVDIRALHRPRCVAVISGKYQGAGITFNAEAGAQWMDLTGLESNLATGVAQSFATTRGTEYHLTFWVGNVYNPGGAFGVSSTIKVYVNGVRKLTATNSLHPANHKQAWKEFALTIRATSSRTTISFINGDPRTDNSNGLDAVRLS
jgi:Protein of unknown function (DUF642)